MGLDSACEIACLEVPHHGSSAVAGAAAMMDLGTAEIPKLELRIAKRDQR